MEAVGVLAKLKLNNIFSEIKDVYIRVELIRNNCLEIKTVNEKNKPSINDATCAQIVCMLFFSYLMLYIALSNADPNKNHDLDYYIRLMNIV